MGELRGACLVRTDYKEMLTVKAMCANLKSTTEYKANRVQCGDTAHGSNPTLNTAVSGLRSIIYHRWTQVLRAKAARLPAIFSQGRFIFRLQEWVYA
jgi:hypothetical protein